MQVSVTFDLNNPQQAEAFDRLRGTMPAVAKTAKVKADPATPAEGPAEAPAAPKGKRGRPSKEEVAAREAAKAAAAGDDDEESEEDDDIEDDEELDEEDDGECCDDAEKKKVLGALRKFAESKGEKGRSLALKTLRKFAPKVEQLKKSQVADVLKALKV